MVNASFRWLILAAMVTVPLVAAQAQDTWYGRLVGAADDGARNQLRLNGFDQVDSFDSGRNSNGMIWYNASSGTCLQVITVNGRVDSAVDIQTHPNCRSQGSAGGSDDGTWYSRLVGAAGDGARNQLRINGFRQVDSFDSGRNSDGTIWYNRSSRQCLQVITVNGRVDSAVDIQTHPKCGSSSSSANASNSDEQGAIDGCVRQLRREGGRDARAGIDVLSSEFSQAGTLVMMRDAGGTEWSCIGYRDGAVGELTVVDGGNGGSTAGRPSEPTTDTVRVRFRAGHSNAHYDATLTPGSSTRYVLGAQERQFMTVRVEHRTGPRLDFQIFNPDGSFLLDMIPTDREYKGELWQSGDHVVEVINRGGKTAEYRVTFSIK